MLDVARQQACIRAQSTDECTIQPPTAIYNYTYTYYITLFYMYIFIDSYNCCSTTASSGSSSCV